MTYQSDEISVHDGQPVELYRLVLRDTSTSWFFTSAAYNIDYDSNEYVATPGLSREQLDETDDILKSDLKIKLPSDHEFSNLFILYIPDGTIDVTIFRGHGTNFIQYWDGVLKSVSPIESDNMASIICGPHTDALHAPFMLRAYNRLCDVPLYGNACGIVGELFRVSCLLNTVSDTVLTSTGFSEFDDDHFKGGYVFANGFKRKIKSHTTNTIVLISAVPGLIAGVVISAYPGCDKTRATCIAKFNNLPEYRGCDWIPNDEPFTQGILK